MSEDTKIVAPVEIRTWRAIQDTFVKAVEKHSKDLPEAQKVKVNKDSVLRARVVKRRPEAVIFEDGFLNGAPLPANIRVMQKFHWNRIEEDAHAPAPSAASTPAPEPEPEPASPPRRVRAKKPRPAADTAPPPRRVRAKFLKTRGTAKDS